MKTEEEKLDALMKESDGGMRPKWFTRTTPIEVIDDCNWRLEGLEIYAFRDPDMDEGWTVEDRTKRDCPEWLVEGICTEDQLIAFLLKIHRERLGSG